MIDRVDHLDDETQVRDFERRLIAENLEKALNAGDIVAIGEE